MLDITRRRRERKDTIKIRRRHLCAQQMKTFHKMKHSDYVNRLNIGTAQTIPQVLQ